MIIKHLNLLVETFSVLFNMRNLRILSILIFKNQEWSINLLCAILCLGWFFFQKPFSGQKTLSKTTVRFLPWKQKSFYLDSSPWPTKSFWKSFLPWKWFLKKIIPDIVFEIVFYLYGSFFLDRYWWFFTSMAFFVRVFYAKIVLKIVFFTSKCHNWKAQNNTWYQTVTRASWLLCLREPKCSRLTNSPGSSSWIPH